MVKMSDTESDLEIEPSVVAYMAAAALREADAKATQDGAAAAAVHAQLSIDALYEAVEMQVCPLKVRQIVTNGVRSLQKCTLDRRSEVVGFT